MGSHLAAFGVVHIDHRAVQLGPIEQGELGLPIVLHATVVVQVVLCEISKHRYLNGHTCQALLSQANARGLHSAGLGTRSHHICQCRLQQHRVGGAVAVEHHFSGYSYT